MTVSMLRGEAGHQRKEIEKLVDWLVADVRPDVVHLSNSMMIGMARMIKENCGPPVICQLSGEDLFLEKLVPPHYEQARALLRERAAAVDAFVALNRYYADFMADYLAVDRGEVHVIPHGLKLDGHGTRHREAARTSRGRSVTSPASATTRACICSSMPASGWRGATTCRRSCCSVAGYLGGGRPALLRCASRSGLRPARWRGRFEYLGRTGPGGQDHVPAIARRVQRADRLSRIEGPARARSDGQRGARGAARSRQLFRNDRRHRRRPALPAARSGGSGRKTRRAAARSRFARLNWASPASRRSKTGTTPRPWRNKRSTSIASYCSHH